MTNADVILSRLLAEIRSNPADDAPRYLCADRLEELGLTDRADFLRLQLELAHPASLTVDMEAVRDHAHFDGRVFRMSFTNDWLTTGDHLIIRRRWGKDEYYLIQQVRINRSSESETWEATITACAPAPAYTRGYERDRLRRLEKELLRKLHAQAVQISDPPLSTPILEDPLVVVQNNLLHYWRGFLDKVDVSEELWLLDAGKVIAMNHPVTNITLTDRMPRQWQSIYPASSGVAWLARPDHAHPEGHEYLAKTLFDCLADGVINPTHGWREYLSKDAAQSSLSQACIRWARS